MRPLRLGFFVLLPLVLTAFAARDGGEIASVGYVLDAPYDTGTLSGRVTDEAGDPLPGVTVALAGTALGAVTGLDGRYTIARVPAGEYDAVASFVGFESVTRRDVEVIVGETTQLDFTLAEAVYEGEEVVVGSEGKRPSGRTESFGATADMALEAAPSAEPMPAAAAPLGDAEPAPSSSGRAVEPEASDDPRRPRPDQSGLLTAGDVDDGLNWGAYLRYVDRTLAYRRPQRHQQRRHDRRRHHQRGGTGYPDLHLGERVVLHVEDREGGPLGGATVRIEAIAGQRTWERTMTTGTDGHLTLFPAYDFGHGVETLRVEVRPSGGGRAVRRTIRRDQFRSGEPVRLRLGQRAAPRANTLDLAFVIDVTGSMGDELRYLTTEFEAIVERVERTYPNADLRYGLVAYRDQGDQFVVRKHDFTRSAREMQRRLAELHASGGGDYPEAMDEALDAALTLGWRGGPGARVAFLVADAPPHDARIYHTMEAVRQARAEGIRIYPVAASGVADQAEYLMRAAAVLTDARYLFLTDDSGVGNPHAEPKIPCYDVTALDGLIARVLEGELEGRRVEPQPREILRSVGTQRRGVCQPDAWAQQPRDEPTRRD